MTNGPGRRVTGASLGPAPQTLHETYNMHTKSHAIVADQYFGALGSQCRCWGGSPIGTVFSFFSGKMQSLSFYIAQSGLHCRTRNRPIHLERCRESFFPLPEHKSLQVNHPPPTSSQPFTSSSHRLQPLDATWSMFPTCHGSR